MANPKLTPPEQEIDAPARPVATEQSAEADQEIDIAGTEADEPAVGAAIEDGRRKPGPDDVNSRGTRR
jgi:hypothetical protein